MDEMGCAARGTPEGPEKLQQSNRTPEQHRGVSHSASPWWLVVGWLCHTAR